ncbi:hypothetical protein BOTCAL_0125g00260 [Botryotinia calthae]|uniref:Uncharacterized protein n=1 Tax=Botryotinia calthae TaxID=38488 RepID=A0A4Y8D4R0_9HELO|nr:hypothetical protein BOTCAL_0125g00260 [Botryotinia calthae]
MTKAKMSLQFIPKRGLNRREVITLLVMVGSQLIIGVMMLRIMIVNQGEASVGIADVLPTMQTPFEGAHHETQKKVNSGESDGKNGKQSGTNIDCGIFGKDAKMLDFKMGLGIDVSEYLLRTKFIIGDRITCHRSFMAEKKNSLAKGLWEVIEGISELEEMASDSKTDSGSADPANTRDSSARQLLHDGAAGAGKTDRELVKVSQNPAYPAAENNRFRKEVEEKMEKNDVEGVLNMVKKSLEGLGPNAQFTQDETSDGESDAQSAEKMKSAQMSKDKVDRALAVLQEIFQDMDEEMKDTERWVRNTETVLESAVNEFKMDWKL